MQRREGQVFRFNCDQKDCTYGTDAAHDMKRHTDNHKGIRYPCELCEYKATTKSTLLKHVRAVHENRREAECPMCGKKFTQGTTCVVHV
jgi:uncharacterized Zn-finger protein